MPISRFRKLLPVLDPTMYQYTPQEYMPDISKLSAVTTGLQQAYDASKNIPIPQHIQTESEMQAVKDMYITPMEEMRNSAVEAFSSGDIAGGMTRLKDLQQQIFEMKQPGGKYYQFEANYNAYQNYQKELADRYAKGDISSEKRDTLLGLSRKGFSSSYDASGNYVPFQGITAAADVDLADKAIKQAQGWRASQVASGALVKGPNGYLSAVTKKYVDPKEVIDAISASLVGDPATTAYLRQEAVMRGLSGDAATEFMNQEIQRAASVAAAKEGFTEVDTKFYKDWELEQGRKFAHEDAKDQGTRLTSYMEVNYGGNPLKIGSNGQLQEGRMFNGPNVIGGDPTLAAAAKVRGKFPKEVTVGVDALYKRNPAELEKEHPGIGAIIGLVPRVVKGADGKNVVRSDQEYNKEVAAKYNSWLENRNRTYVGFERFNDQQQTRATNEIFGQRESPGNAPYMQFYLTAPGKPMQPITYEELMKQVGAADFKELRNKASVNGAMDPNNPVSPAGYTVTIAGKGRKAYNILATTTTEEERNHNDSVWRLTQPRRDLSVNQTPAIRWDYGADPNDPNDPGYLYLRSQRVVGTDEAGNVREGLQFYQATDIDEDGNPSGWEPANITEEQLMSANRATSPFRETVVNKRLK